MNYAVFVRFVTVASVASYVTGFAAESQIITVLNVSSSMSKYDLGRRNRIGSSILTIASVASE